MLERVTCTYMYMYMYMLPHQLLLNLINAYILCKLKHVHVCICIMLHVHVDIATCTCTCHMHDHTSTYCRSFTGSLRLHCGQRFETLQYPPFLSHSFKHTQTQTQVYTVPSKIKEGRCHPPPPPPLITCSTPLMSNYYIQYLYSISCTCTGTCSGSPVVVNYCMCIHRCMDRQTFIPSGK